jgi:hypothetical protein
MGQNMPMGGQQQMGQAEFEDGSAKAAGAALGKSNNETANDNLRETRWQECKGHLTSGMLA